MPGLQPEIVALSNAPGAHGGHVTEAMGNGDMPRSSTLAACYIFGLVLRYCYCNHVLIALHGSY